MNIKSLSLTLKKKSRKLTIKNQTMQAFISTPNGCQSNSFYCWFLPSAVFFVLIWSHAKPPWAATALVAPRILPNPHDFLLTSLHTISLLLDSVSVSSWTHSLNSVHASWFSHFLLLSKSPALIPTTMLLRTILPEWNPPHFFTIRITRLSQWLPWNLFIFMCDIKFQPPHLGCLYWPT